MKLYLYHRIFLWLIHLEIPNCGFTILTWFSALPLKLLRLLINDYRKHKRCILKTRLVEGHVKQIAFGHTFNRWISFVMWGGGVLGLQ